MSKVLKRLIGLSVNGVNRADEIAAAVISSTESDFRALCAPTARRDYFILLKVAQDHASGTLWDLIWTGTGTRVTGTYAPYGNTTPSTAQPLYDFVATVIEPDGDFLGGEATTALNAVATVEVKWPLLTRPTKRTT